MSKRDACLLVNLSAGGEFVDFFHRELKNHESVRRVDAAA